MRSILLSLFILCFVSFNSDAQFLTIKHWKPGYYYDLKGNKTEGLISKHESYKGIFKDYGDYILFKKNKDDQKIEISSDSITSFVVDSQLFVVSHFEDLKKTPFIQVIIDGKIKLYLSQVESSTPGGFTGAPGTQGSFYAGGYSSSSDHYYFGSDPNNLTKLKRKNFIETMSQIMVDKPLVVVKIKDKTYELREMDDLISFYKTGIMPDHEEVETSSE